jgi:hypothetical protein
MLLIRGDLQLVAKQVLKEYDCNNEMMVGYLEKSAQDGEVFQRD